jgi:hypothetical protein
MSSDTLLPSAKQTSRLLLAVLPALFCGAVPLVAQEQGGVVVTVVNRETSQPLRDVSVRVQGTGIGGLTAADGSCC